MISVKPYPILSRGFEIGSMMEVDFINIVSYVNFHTLAFNCYEFDLNLNKYDDLNKTSLDHIVDIDHIYDVYNENNGVIKLNNLGNICECLPVIFMKFSFILYKHYRKLNNVKQANTFMDIYTILKNDCQHKFNRKVTQKVINRYFINYQKLMETLECDPKLIELEKKIFDAIYNNASTVYEDSEELLKEEINKLKQEINTLRQDNNNFKRLINVMDMKFDKRVRDMQDVICNLLEVLTNKNKH